MSQPGIEPRTSRSRERTLYLLSYQGRNIQNCVLMNDAIKRLRCFTATTIPVVDPEQTPFMANFQIRQERLLTFPLNLSNTALLPQRTIYHSSNHMNHLFPAPIMKTSKRWALDTCSRNNLIYLPSLSVHESKHTIWFNHIYLQLWKAKGLGHKFSQH